MNKITNPRATRAIFIDESDIEPQIPLGFMKNFTGGDTMIDLGSIGFLTPMKSIDHNPLIINPVQITITL